MVKTLQFHCMAPGFIPDWETKIPCGTWHGQKVKIKKNTITNCSNLNPREIYHKEFQEKCNQKFFCRKKKKKRTSINSKTKKTKTARLSSENFWVGIRGRV